MMTILRLVKRDDNPITQPNLKKRKKLRKIPAILSARALLGLVLIVTYIKDPDFMLTLYPFANDLLEFLFYF